MPHFRKSVQSLTAEEKANYVNAVTLLMQPDPQSGRSRHDEFVAIHAAVGGRLFSGSQGWFTTAHGGANFLSWHRYFLRSYEEALRDVSGNRNLVIPYWDWTPEGTAATFAADFMGTLGPGPIADGPLAGQVVNHPRAGPITRNPQPLTNLRQLVASVYSRVGSRAPILELPANSDSDYVMFQRRLESEAHDNVHVWIGGDMGSIPTAVRDPVFMLHHCNVDRIWAIWQQRQLPNLRFPASGQNFSHNLNDLMFPWDGNAARAERGNDGSQIHAATRAKLQRSANQLDQRASHWTSYDVFKGNVTLAQDEAGAQLLRGESHAWRFEVAERATYRLFTEGNNDIHSWLYGPQNCANCFGELIAEDAVSGTGLNSSIQITLQPGVYHLIVAPRLATAPATPYVLKARRLGQAAAFGNMPRLELGLTVRANIGAMWEVDSYLLHIDTAAAIAIYTGGPTDTMLFVYNSERELLAMNDDAVGTLNSSLTITLQPGDYIVSVRGYESEIGRYELTARPQ